jgi:hypothetical protein
MASFEWTEARVTASELLAARNLNHEEIAQRVGVARSTLWLWRKLPEFAARVDEITEAIRSETRRIVIADKERRLAALNDRWNRMRLVIEERANDPDHAKAPGGGTGLLVRTIKSVRDNDATGDGPKMADVEEFAVDTGLLRELREIEKQAAMELGQWDEPPPDDDPRDEPAPRIIVPGLDPRRGGARSRA